MKNKITIKNRLKKYFTEKPKGDFWMWAFITLFIFKYVGYPSVIFLAFMMVGLLSPELSVEAMNKTFTTTSENLVDIFVMLMQKIFLIGQSIAINNPLIAKVLFFALGNIVWVYWVAMIILFFQLCRYFISWLIKKLKK